MKTLALALTSLVLAAGCGSEDQVQASLPPTADPQYRGTVIEVERDSMLVRGEGDCGIWVSTDDSTDVRGVTIDSYDDRSWLDLEPGMTVDLYIPGPIAESCPMQGTAELVVIDESSAP